MPYTILIVDVDPMSRNLLCHTISEGLGYATHAAASVAEGMEILTSGRQPLPNVVLLDVGPGVEAVEAIRTLRPLYPQMSILVLVQEREIKKAMDAVKAGANDFITRPVLPERLNIAIINALRAQSLGEEVARLRRNNHVQVMFADVLGQSPLLRAAVALGQKAVASTTPVLLQGEAGTGRELLARAIHAAGDRISRPFVVVDCAQSEKILETIFFGQEAPYRTAGRLREAGRGTLYLNNIDKLPSSLQVKLLQLLREGRIENYSFDARVIAATSVDIAALVKQGSFRSDLYYPFEALAVRMPALRERREDILLLAECYLRRFAAIENKTIRGYAHDLAEALLKYDWPGNVRQLEQMVCRAVMLCDSNMLERRHFPPAISGARIRAPITSDLVRASHSALTLLDMVGNVRRIVELEAEIIQFALRHYDGHMSEVARRLGIGRSTLYRKINDYNIKEDASPLAVTALPQKLASA